jgi:hypothetical protein
MTDADDLTESRRKVKQLESELFDLKIASRAKDFFIERLEKDRDQMAKERK